MPNHDGAYHRLFSVPHLVRELLVEVIKPHWLPDVDLFSLERINYKFHGIGLKGKGIVRREGDILWKLRHRGGFDIYIVLMVEFQNRPDRWMPVRWFVYIGHFYQNLIQEGKLCNGLLPPVFPIVLYNGDAKWNAPLSLKELIAIPADASLHDFQPDLRYHLIDEVRYSRETLGSLESVVACIIRLEQAIDPEEAQVILRQLQILLRSEDLTEVRRSVADFLGNAGVMEKLAMNGTNFLQVLEGGTSMIAKNVERWTQQWEQQGIEKGILTGLQRGREEGRQEGLQKGLHTAIVTSIFSVLKARFSLIPLDLAKSLSAIPDSDTLEELLPIAATAQSVDEFLEALKLRMSL